MRSDNSSSRFASSWLSTPERNRTCKRQTLRTKLDAQFSIVLSVKLKMELQRLHSIWNHFSRSSHENHLVQHLKHSVAVNQRHQFFSHGINGFAGICGVLTSRMARDMNTRTHRYRWEVYCIIDHFISFVLCSSINILKKLWVLLKNRNSLRQPNVKQTVKSIKDCLYDYLLSCHCHLRRT